MKLVNRIIAVFIFMVFSVGVATSVKPVKKRAFVLPTTTINHATVESAEKSDNVAAAVIGKKAILEAASALESKTIVPDIIKYARTQLGKRYVYGSPGPHTFDCSGFTGHVFNQFGYKLNRSSRDQYKQGVSVKTDEAQPGDLIFFGGRRGGSGVGHVGMVIEVDPATHTMKFIHAATGGVQITNFPDGGYYSRRFVGIRRVLSDQDRGE